METEILENNILEEIEPISINRSTIICHFTKDFYLWYQAFENKTEDIPSNEILDRPFIFLAPPLEEEELMENFFDENFDTIFEHMIEETFDDTQVIEAVFQAGQSNSWVEYQLSTETLDLASDYELAHEEDDDDEPLAQA